MPLRLFLETSEAGRGVGTLNAGEREQCRRGSPGGVSVTTARFAGRIVCEEATTALVVQDMSARDRVARPCDSTAAICAVMRRLTRR